MPEGTFRWSQVPEDVRQLRTQARRGLRAGGALGLVGLGLGLWVLLSLYVPSLNVPALVVLMWLPLTLALLGLAVVAMSRGAARGAVRASACGFTVVSYGPLRAGLGRVEIGGTHLQSLPGARGAGALAWSSLIPPGKVTRLRYAVDPRVVRARGGPGWTRAAFLLEVDGVRLPRPIPFHVVPV